MLEQKRPAGPGLAKTRPKEITVRMEPEAYREVESAAIVIMKIYAPEKKTAISLVLSNMNDLDDGLKKAVKMTLTMDIKDFEASLDSNFKVRFNADGAHVLFKLKKVARDNFFTTEEPVFETLKRAAEKN